MSLINTNDSIILVIDIQTKLLQSVFNPSQVLKKSAIMAKAASILNIPAIVTEQYPVGLGSTIDELMQVLPNDTRYFEKNTFSALDNLEIAELLRVARKKQVILFGIETHICVSQTAIALTELGYDVYLISDACSSRQEVEYISGLERMKEHGVHILTAEITLFEWLRSSKHPKFKEIQNLIK